MMPQPTIRQAIELTAPHTAAVTRFVTLAASDRQYAAALFLFACLRWPDKRRACFDQMSLYGIEKGKLLRQIRAWSHGEQVLIKVALDLFDPGCVRNFRHRPAGFGEAVSVLDSGHMDDVITAMRIARGHAVLVISRVGFDETHGAPTSTFALEVAE